MDRYFELWPSACNMCKRPYVSINFFRFKVKFSLVSQGQTEEHRNQGMITLHYLDQKCSLSQLDMKLRQGLHGVHQNVCYKVY